MRVLPIIIIVAFLALAGGAYYYFAAEKTELGLKGPAFGRGVSVEEIDEVTLTGEVEVFAGHNMRARYVVVEPGGVVPLHVHERRPALSYVVNGEIIEHRSDADGPMRRVARDLTVDNNIAQWWKNESDETIRIFVVDIYETASGGGH